MQVLRWLRGLSWTHNFGYGQESLSFLHRLPDIWQGSHWEGRSGGVVGQAR